MGQYSTFLFPQPTFLEGVARLVDFRGDLNQYNQSRSEAEADERALRADWLAVGDDIRQAISVFEESHPQLVEEVSNASSQ